MPVFVFFGYSIRALKTSKKKAKREKATSKKTPMMLENQEEILTRIKHIIEPLCECEGMELVQVEYQREARGRTLRLYIDKPGGVKLDDCAHISRQVSDLLDVELSDLKGPYNLEVSSPGLNRPLVKETDFERFKGKSAKIKTLLPINGQKNFRGVLLGISDGIVELMMGDKRMPIPFMEISRARLINNNGES